MKVSLDIHVVRKGRKPPLMCTPRVMYAVVGRKGGVCAFAESAWKARSIRDEMFNIGHNKPVKCLVSFKEIKGVK